MGEQNRQIKPGQIYIFVRCADGLVSREPLSDDSREVSVSVPVEDSAALTGGLILTVDDPQLQYLLSLNTSGEKEEMGTGKSKHFNP